jgi:hypothetical protein
VHGWLVHPVEGNAVKGDVLPTILEVLPGWKAVPKPADVVLLLECDAAQSPLAGICQEDDTAKPRTDDDGVIGLWFREGMLRYSPFFAGYCTCLFLYCSITHSTTNYQILIFTPCLYDGTFVKRGIFPVSFSSPGLCRNELGRLPMPYGSRILM